MERGTAAVYHRYDRPPTVGKERAPTDKQPPSPAAGSAGRPVRVPIASDGTIVAGASAKGRLRAGFSRLT